MLMLVHALRLKLHLCSVTLPGAVRASRPFTLCWTGHIKKKIVNKKKGEKKQGGFKGVSDARTNTRHSDVINSEVKLGCHLYERLMLY